MSYREQVVQFIIKNSGTRDSGLVSFFLSFFLSFFRKEKVEKKGGGHVLEWRAGSSSGAPDLGSLQSADPFTGQNAYGGSASSSAAASSLKYLPKTSFILFDTSPNFDGLKKKMFAFNQEFTASEDASVRELGQVDIMMTGSLSIHVFLYVYACLE